eukprot:TRINITY_DN10791_c0_g1_i1.p1 TRINITY_DN10791_c0_g1~~TRINITY_DN10791_c0_g1_i1.p1  ORF type:complete len:506 (+),score=86.70 TRINITY_DN10791_c0_g1_i1:157-1518(+)
MESNLILRQRNAKKAGGVLKAEETSTFTRAIQGLDMYPKVKKDHLRKQTSAGAAISVTVAVIMGLMIIIECYHYATGVDALHDRLSVDAGINQKVFINLNISFPNIKCDALHLDAMDAAGEMQVNVKHDLYKSPVTSDGKLVFSALHEYHHSASVAETTPAPESRKQEALDAFMLLFGGVAYDSSKDPNSPDFCGPCDLLPAANAVNDHVREAGGKPTCCNTCEQVLQYYDRRKQPRPDKSEIDQCVHEESVKNPGCNIAGVVVTEKVKGNFHFSPGGTRRYGMKMLHVFSTAQALSFDTSHVIHHISFTSAEGESAGWGKRVDPLDGRKFNVPVGNLGRIRYSIQAIPVRHATSSDVEEIEQETGDMIAGIESRDDTSFELSATVSEKIFRPQAARSPPSLVFVYDFHPMQITHIFQRPPVTHFVVELCKIIGGLFVVTGLLDRMVGKLLQK